jgi:Protein of unknown function (DUF2752)
VSFAGRPIPLDDPDLRVAAAALLGCATARAALPGDPGVPCPLRELTGVPCPLCGLTTSATEIVELDVAAGIAANPGGLVLILLGLAILLGGGKRLVVSSSLVYFGLAAMWLWELNRFAVI